MAADQFLMGKNVATHFTKKRETVINAEGYLRFESPNEGNTDEDINALQQNTVCKLNRLVTIQKF